jgi:hypothetical protein
MFQKFAKTLAVSLPVLCLASTLACGPRLGEAPQGEAPAPLAVRGLLAVLGHGRAYPARSRVTRGSPALGTPWDVQAVLAAPQGFQAVHQRPPT